MVVGGAAVSCQWISKYKSESQLTFTCLKSIIETLEKGAKYVQS